MPYYGLPNSGTASGIESANSAQGQMWTQMLQNYFMEPFVKNMFNQTPAAKPATAKTGIGMPGPGDIYGEGYVSGITDPNYMANQKPKQSFD